MNPMLEDCYASYASIICICTHVCIDRSLWVNPMTCQEMCNQINKAQEEKAAAAAAQQAEALYTGIVASDI